MIPGSNPWGVGTQSIEPTPEEKVVRVDFHTYQKDPAYCCFCSGKVSYYQYRHLMRPGAGIPRPPASICSRCEEEGKWPGTDPGSSKKKHKPGGARPPVRFCPYGHDTFEVGRTKDGDCKACKRERRAARKREGKEGEK